MRAIVKGTAIVLGLLLLLLLTTVIGVAVFSKQLTEYALETILARKVTFAGKFDVDWGRIVRVHAEDVSVSNVEWAIEPAFFATQVLDLAIDIPALIDGEIIFPLVHLTGFELNLARSTQRKVNWEFGEEKAQRPQQPASAPIIPQIVELTIDNGSLVYRDLGAGSEVAAFIGSLQGRVTHSAVELRGLGKFQDNPLTFDFAAGGTKALDGPAPYEIALAIEAGTTTARIAGTLAHPLKMKGLDMSVTLQGEGLHELAALAGRSLPATASYRIDGALRQHEKIWRLADFDGRIGETDLHGDITLDFSGPRPMLAADLVSNQLDADLVVALINGAPKEHSEVMQTPQAPISLSKLRAVDAQVQLVVHEILSAEFPIDEVSVKLTLEDGLLLVDPVKVRLAKGALTGEITLNASGEQPSGKIALTFDRVALAPIAALAKRDYPVSGAIDGELALVFAGGSIEIADGSVDYRAPELDTDLHLTLARVEADPVDLLRISTRGTFRGEPAKATFVGAPLTMLFAAEQSYPVRFEAHIAKTDVAASGTITAFGSTFDLEIAASGHGTARLSKLFGLELPLLPAYAVSGHVIRGENIIDVTGLKARVGASDVAGSVRVNTQSRKPCIKADLKSQTLVYSDLEQWRNKENGSTPPDLTRLEDFNADVHLTAKRVIAPDQVIFSNVVVDGRVADGRLTLKPLKFGVAGGQVLATLAVGEIDHRLVGQVNINIDAVDLGIALQPIGLAKRFAGTLDADLDLAFDPRDKARGEGVIRYRETQSKTDAKLVIAQTAESLEIEASGSFHGESFQLGASLGKLSKLVSNERYPVDIRISVAETQAFIQGTVGSPLQLKDLELTLKIAGPSPQRLHPILRLNLPDLPPYEIAGALSRHGEIWKFENFKGSVGDSLLSGEIAVDAGADKPFLRARLESLHLDFDDLGPLLGQPPDANETASPQQIAEAKLLAKRGRTLPDKPFNFDRLKAMNADVHFHAASVASGVAPLDDATIHLTLTDGRMTLKPIEFGVAGGKLRLTVVLDAGPEPAQGTLDAEISGIDLAKLLQPFEIAKGTRGVIEGQGSLSFQGTTFAQLLGDLSGDAKLLVNEGRLNALLVELAGIDGGESLLAWLHDGVQLVPLRCAFADLVARDGIVHVERFVLDSADTKFNLDGDVSLKEETLDLTIKAHPKDVSFPAARAPLLLEGTFKNPEFHVAKASLIARGLAALALAVLAPPAALLALIEPGMGDDAPCDEFAQALAEGHGFSVAKARD